MYLIVVGGGKTGSQLAAQLLKGGHRVVVIEDRPAVVERLKQELPDEVVLFGDGSSPNCLEAADIQHANVLAAVTGDDDANLVITTLARFEFDVPRVIARVNNPKNAWLFTPEMGVDVAINQADIMAKLIAEEMSIGDILTLAKLRRGQYALVEEKVDPQSTGVGKAVRDLGLPCACAVVAILRRGELIIPREDTVLEPIDEVIAVVRSDQEADFARLLARA